MEEIVEKPFTITKEDLPAIAEALKKMGKLTPARYLSSIESIHEDGNFFCFVLSKIVSLKNNIALSKEEINSFVHGEKVRDISGL